MLEIERGRSNLSQPTVSGCILYQSEDKIQHWISVKKGRSSVSQDYSQGSWLDMDLQYFWSSVKWGRRKNYSPLVVILKDRMSWQKRRGVAIKENVTIILKLWAARKVWKLLSISNYCWTNPGVHVIKVVLIIAVLITGIVLTYDVGCTGCTCYLCTLCCSLVLGRTLAHRHLPSALEWHAGSHSSHSSLP